MNDNFKNIEIDERKFSIKKYDAKTSIKIAKLIFAKVLPALNGFIPEGENSAEGGNFIEKLKDAQSKAVNNDALSLEGISKALDLISDDDLDKIIDKSLYNCFEILKSGNVRVLNTNGTYAVEEIEDDPFLVMRLTAEVILWSYRDFFTEGRLGSIFSPLVNTFRSNVAM